jgi:hypothetical protein
VRTCVVLALAGGCSFQHGTAPAEHDAAGVDAPPDAMIDAPPLPSCPADPHLRLCFSFDQDPLPPSLPDEGAANVSATLTNVMHTTHGASGAVQIDTTSTIHVPYTAEVTGIQSIELWYRADAEPPTDGARIGLVDSNVIPPNISLFLFRTDPGHQLRCGMGSALQQYSATLVLGTWYHVACICENDTLRVYLDGAKIGETATSGCASGGAFVSDGLTIGQNNNGGPSGANEWLVGAIDGVRLWDVAVPASL